MKIDFYHIKNELFLHLPFSIFSTCIGIIFIGILNIFLKNYTLLKAEELFHVFHILHLFLSALATTSMFWSHERKFFKAIIIGFLGSVLICNISDIIFPFIGGGFFKINMNLHICILDHTVVILLFVFIGIFLGIILEENTVKKHTIFSHFAHVLISVFASGLYLLSFGLYRYCLIEKIHFVFLIIIVAVMVPCCISDIIFPLSFIKNIKEKRNNDYKNYKEKRPK